MSQPDMPQQTEQQKKNSVYNLLLLVLARFHAACFTPKCRKTQLVKRLRKCDYEGGRRIGERYFKSFNIDYRGRFYKMDWLKKYTGMSSFEELLSQMENSQISFEKTKRGSTQFWIPDATITFLDDGLGPMDVFQLLRIDGPPSYDMTVTIPRAESFEEELEDWLSSGPEQQLSKGCYSDNQTDDEMERKIFKLEQPERRKERRNEAKRLKALKDKFEESKESEESDYWEYQLDFKPFSESHLAFWFNPVETPEEEEERRKEGKRVKRILRNAQCEEHKDGPCPERPHEFSNCPRRLGWDSSDSEDDQW